MALVTGSTSGIGEATARLFAAEGASVLVNSASSVGPGEALAAELPDAAYVQGDVSVEAQAAALVTSAVERWGRLDVLVNNAGTTVRIPHADLGAVTDEVWRRILDVNVMGTWYVTRAAVPALRAAGGGAIVNVTSLAGVRPTGSSIPYAVSKAALNHLTRLLAGVLGPDIRVNAVAPGLVDTPWTAGWDDVREAVRRRAPLGRSAVPADVAQACLSMAVAGFVTGQVLVVDGGMGLR
ncbi:MAG: SDR family NAD(P)-dependent oxidoreductase [Acidimicrobiales bacterium]